VEVCTCADGTLVWICPECSDERLVADTTNWSSQQLIKCKSAKDVCECGKVLDGKAERFVICGWCGGKETGGVGKVINM
jgi:hypothetical protein